MLKAIKIRLYPSKEQMGYINRQLGCCRLIYNSVLGWKKQLYESEKRSPSNEETRVFIKNLKIEKPFLKEVHSKALQQSLIDLNTAYNNFFRGLEKGQNIGFPKFKCKKKYNDSCRYPVDAFIGVKGNRISFTRALNDIHFKCSRRDEKYLNKRQNFVRSTTIRRTSSGEYYASILIDYENSENQAIHINGDVKSNSVGIDVGIKAFAVTSDGEIFESMKFTKLEREIKKYQRQLAKTENDSKRHHRIRRKLAKKHEKVANKRLWYHHYVANSLLKDNYIIAVEDLNVSGMLKNHKLAKALQEHGIGNFFTILSYKAEWQHNKVIKVGRFFASSKTCHSCGYKNKNLSLSERAWECPVCGSHIDRDYNAALNILKEGIRIYKENIGLSSPEFTHVDCPTVDDRCSYNLKSSGRLNREKNVFQ